jgi:hypothetical protein
VYLPGRTGFLAKSTTLMMAWGCWMLLMENAFRVIRLFRDRPWSVARKLKVDGRATEMCKSDGMAMSLEGIRDICVIRGQADPR